MLTAAALRLLPWRRIIPALAIFAVVGSVIAWHVHRVDLAREQGHEAGSAEVQAQWDRSDLDQQNLAARTFAERRKLEQERAAALMKEIENAQQAAETARLDADRARSDVDRLRIAAKAAAARDCRAGSSPATAASGPTAGGGMLAEVLSDLAEAGAAVAAEADRRGIAGAACERAYGALTPSE